MFVRLINTCTRKEITSFTTHDSIKDPDGLVVYGPYVKIPCITSSMVIKKFKYFRELIRARVKINQYISSVKKKEFYYRYNRRIILGDGF